MRAALLLGLLAAAASAQDAPRLVPQATTVWLPDLTFSADGDRLLSVDRTGGAALWDVATGATLLPLPGQGARPAPDGATLAQRDARWRLSLWDLTTTRQIGWLGPEAAEAAEVAFVGPGRLVLATGDGTAAVRDMRTGRVLVALDGWTDAWFLDPYRTRRGRVAARDTAGRTRLWDAATGAPTPGLDDLWDWEASADGDRLLATVGPPGRPGRRWEVWAGRPATRRLRIDGADGVWPEAGLTRALVAEGGRVRVVDLDDATATEGPPHAAPVREASLGADGRWAATLDRAGALRVWDVASGGVAVAGVPGGEAPWAVEVAPGGGLVAVMAEDGARVWALPAGREVLRVSGTVVFGPAGRHVATEVLEPERWSYVAVDVWDPATGERTRLTDAGASPTFSPDGRHLALATPAGVAVWDVATGRLRSTLHTRVSPIARAAFGPGGRSLVTAALPADSAAGGLGLRVHLWDAAGAGAPRRVAEGSAMDTPPVLSPDGTRVLGVESEDGTVRVWDAATGEVRSAWGGEAEAALAAGWTAAGGLAVVAAGGALDLRDVETGAVVRPLAESRGDPLAAALSADGRRVAAVYFEGPAEDGELRWEEAREGRELRVWDAATGAPLGRPQALPGLAVSVAFDPTGERLVTAQVGGAVRLWEVAGGAGPVLDGHLADTATSAVFGPDGRLVLSTGRDGVVRTWDAATGAPGPTVDGYGGPVDGHVFSPDGRRAVTPRDGGAAVWDVATGAELVRLLLLDDGGWLVVTPDGRFDAPDLEAVDAAVWVAPDDPLTPLPIEAFMADFYEPRLLARVLAGEAFPDLGRLLDRNRVQPAVEIVSTDANGDGTATVTVRVTGEARDYGGARHASGAHDLRLFRDGRLVGWRDGALVDGVGAETVVFEGVPLPSDADSVAFSAYAFNGDRVKSRTARATLAVPASARPRRPRRAFVVSLGVDAFADPAWDLAFAAADARAMTDALGRTLAALDDYDAVVTVPLLSDGTADHGTAAALRGSLLRLAGAPLDPAAEAALAAVPGADRLVEATPDDAVIVTASTHGYAGPDGVFYLLPSDVPETGRRLTPELLEAAVSSDELAAWLRGVDAGALAVVVDACNAAGAVEGTGFKPGPMGARGLGQLAFDKGAAVLTATQADAPALEAEATGRGLLTFALVDNGLLAGQADADADGRVTLAEWLEYGIERVPALAAEVRAGAVETYGRGGVRARQMTDEEADEAAAPGLQTPALFDFRRGGRAVPVAGRAP